MGTTAGLKHSPTRKACTVGNHAGRVIFYAPKRGKVLKDMVELVAREDEGLFPRNVELRHLDVGHGIAVDILAVRYGPAHAVVKDRENRFDRGA